QDDPLLHRSGRSWRNRACRGLWHGGRLGLRRADHRPHQLPRLLRRHTVRVAEPCPGPCHPRGVGRRDPDWPESTRMTRLVDTLTAPIIVALALIFLLLIVGEMLSPGFASPTQIMRLLIVAALLGIVAAGQNLVILGGREGIDLSVGGVVSLSAIIAG